MDVATTKETAEYAKNFLVFHLRRSGKDNAQIERFLQSIPLGPTRDHFVAQHIKHLPPKEQASAAKRLNQKN